MIQVPNQRSSRAVGWGLGVALALGVGCSPGGGTTDGRLLFEAVCARCHATSGKGDPVEKARLGVPDMTDAAWQASHADADIRRTIVEGSREKKMPAFGPTAFDERQLDALVAHVRRLGGR